MRNKLIVALGIIFSWSFGSFSVVGAESIGISPPSIDVRIFSGEARIMSLNVSRSTTEGDMTFGIVNNGIALLTISPDTIFVIPNGQLSAYFSFKLDAANADNGDYKGILEFHLQPREGTMYSSHGMGLEFVLKAKIDATVFDRPNSSTPLSLTEFPELVSGIGLADYSIEKQSKAEGIDILFQYSLTNSENNPLTGASSFITVTRYGNTFLDSRNNIEGLISANGTLQQFVSFTLPRQYSSGKYDVHIVAGDEEIFTTFWIIKPIVWFCIAGIAISLIASGLAAYTLLERRRR